MGILDAPAADSTGRLLRSFRAISKDEVYAGFQASAGNRVAFLGDSITQAGWAQSLNFQGESIPLFATLLSAGRLLTVVNAGIGGQRSDQMLARFDTDVTPYAPDVVHLMAGTNDSGQGKTLAEFKASMTAIIKKIRDIGAIPVLGTIIPNNNTQKLIIPGWNAWLKAYASQQGITIMDYYSAMVDPAGGMQSTFNSGDGTHPNALGYRTMAQILSDVLSPTLPINYPPMVQDNADPSSLLGNNAIFLTDANADGVPDGWFAYGGSSGYAHALVTDSSVKGKMAQITQTANGSIRAMQRSITGWAVGDKLSIAGVITSDGGVTAQVKVTFTGPGTNAQPANFKAAITRGVFYQEVVIPAGTTGITLDLIASSGTGVVSWGQVTVRNLTALMA